MRIVAVTSLWSLAGGEAGNELVDGRLGVAAGREFHDDAFALNISSPNNQDLIWLQERTTDNE